MVITDGGKEDFGIDTTYVKVPRTKFLGVTMTFIVTEGKLLLGGSQGIFFEEFDGPRKRNYFVKVVEG